MATLGRRDSTSQGNKQKPGPKPRVPVRAFATL